MRKSFLYFIAFLILTACAQVKTLTGGPKDESAPKTFGLVPANETTNFQGKAVAMTFDEYVKLNNPAQTISIMPADAKIKTQLRDKTLMLYWEEDLRENTTYSIFLNKTITDITENNDTIIQYVFSTGATIDSLSYTTFVVDAKDNKPKNGIVVGLFEHPDSLKPLYFAQTNQEGKATFNYMREGLFYVRAFEDLSKQGKIGKNDAIAFKEDPIIPAMDLIDSVPMRMFTTQQKPDLKTIKYVAPSTFAIGATAPLTNMKITVNGDTIPQNQIKFIERDSVHILYQPVENSQISIAAYSEEWTDTIKVRVPNTRNKSQRITPLKTDFFGQQPIILQTYDLISSIDTSKISFFYAKDSSFLKDYSFEIVNGNEIHFYLPNFSGERIRLIVPQGAIKGSNGWTFMNFEQVFNKKGEKEFGVLNVKISGYEQPIILETILKNKVVRKDHVDAAQILKMEQLEPGDYTFKVTIDLNNNQQWDTGNFQERTQPEEIQYFSTPTKVRANWEIEIELVPSK